MNTWFSKQHLDATSENSAFNKNELNVFNRSLKIFLFFFILVTGLQLNISKAATVTVSANTNWSAINTGSGAGGIPTSADIVQIQNAFTLTVDVPNAVCSSLLINIPTATNSTTSILKFNASSQLTVSGSLTIGGIIAVLAIAVRKEMMIPLLCGIFLVENLSVIIQVSYFKYTKKRFGEGRRIFLMSPLHHHYQKKGYHESKIVTRFWIVGIILAILSIVTLKLR